MESSDVISEKLESKDAIQAASSDMISESKDAIQAASSDMISESKDAIQAASSEVAFEEFQMKTTTAAIYVLDKTLYDCAVKLKEFLIQDCNIKVCSEGHGHWREHIRDTIAETSANIKNYTISSHTEVTSTDVSIRGYGYLESLIIEAKRKDEGLHHDVIILLGHSSVLLAEDKDLVETFAKLNPTIIAFLGCCGGNTRYGPILTMSYMLRNTSWEIPSPMIAAPPIIAFYQRQIYTDELKNTSLIIGLQYYLHFCYGDDGSYSSRAQYFHFNKRDTAKYAFALANAKLNESAVPPTYTDPTVFINDKDGKNPVQMILHKCGLTTEAAPLSCMQLAMYSPMVVHVDSRVKVRSFTVEDKWPKYWPKYWLDRQIILPKESCFEHKLVIDDVLWQLDQQRIKITIHGAIPDIYIETNTREPYAQIRIFYKTLPKQITVSEDPKSSKASQWTKVSEDLQGIEVILKTPNDSSKISHSDFNQTQGVQITFSTSDGDLKDISIDKHGTEITFCICNKYTSISQDQQSCETQILIIDLHGVGVGITVDELSKVCSEKIEELQLHRIMPLVCEIKFIKLLKDTLKLMRTGDKSSWEKIDPLQFLIAVLRGHWGQIKADIIKKWATYYLKKSMSNVKKDNPEALHQYKLCCMCFVLLFEDSFVRFVKDEKDYHQYVIIVCIKEKNKLNDVIKTDDSPQSLPDESPTPFPPDKDPLSCWVDLLQHCKPISDCVDLYNKDNHPNYKWAIGNRYGPKLGQQENTYDYKYAEFLLVMGALSDECQKKEDALRRICYHVSEFENKNDKEKGRMKCFTDDPKDIEEMDKTIVKKLFIVKSEIEGLSFIETRLLLDCSKQNQKLDKKLQGDKVNLIEKLLDLYKKDPAMWHLPDVPTLEEVTKTTLYEAAEDTSDDTLLNQVIGRCLHQACATLSIERSLCQAVKNCTATNWDKVSSCRFVFAQFMTDKKHEIKGILFYTETHYGDNLIDFNEEQLDELDELKCTCYNKKTNCYKMVTKLITPRPVSRKNLLKAITTLKGPCRYRMLQITIKQMKDEKILIFPFVKVGRLTLTYDENGQLKRIDLEKCAECVAMEKYKQMHP